MQFKYIKIDAGYRVPENVRFLETLHPRCG
jgi:hypothetical protein